MRRRLLGSWHFSWPGLIEVGGMPCASHCYANGCDIHNTLKLKMYYNMHPPSKTPFNGILATRFLQLYSSYNANTSELTGTIYAVCILCSWNIFAPRLQKWGTYVPISKSGVMSLVPPTSSPHCVFVCVSVTLCVLSTFLNHTTQRDHAIFAWRHKYMKIRRSHVNPRSTFETFSNVIYEYYGDSETSIAVQRMVTLTPTWVVLILRELTKSK